MRPRTVLVLAVALSSLACGGLADTIGDAIEDQIAELERGAPPAGEVEPPEPRDAVALPDAWPADVPVAEGMTLVATSCAGTPGESGFSCLASGESREAPEALAAWYEGRMTGWTKLASADLGTLTTITWTRGPEAVAVSLTKGETTVVAVTYTRQ